jgi:hypothetical protein
MTLAAAILICHVLGVCNFYFRVLQLILHFCVPFLNRVLEMISFSLQTHIKYHELILITCVSSAGESEDTTS